MSNIKSIPAPTARVVDLTPDMASKLLDKNVKNRVVSKRNHATLVRSMTNGEWELNGEAIKIDTNGFVLDGQHRLHAILESGVTIRTFIIEGLPASTQDTMDTGKSRGLADVLTIRGEASATTVASIARRVFIFRRHGLRAATVASYPTTVKEVLRFLDDNEWIKDLPTAAQRIGRTAKMPGSLAGLLMVAFSEVDRDDANDFFDKLSTGAGLAPGDPILALRKVLLTMHESRGTNNQTHVAALAIKAWNKYRAGETVTLLKFAPGGSTPEKFPEPK
jgi:hypothetical protein